MHKSERLKNLKAKQSAKKESATALKGTSKIKWRTIIALILVYIALILNWQWIWGILFLFWVIPDIFSGVTYFIEPIERSSHPVLYWIIIVSWILMSLYSLSELFIDYDQFYY